MTSVTKKFSKFLACSLQKIQQVSEGTNVCFIQTVQDRAFCGGVLYCRPLGSTEFPSLSHVFLHVV